ncbi:Tryptophan synthase alpha chain [Frankliniella fusca]|uniref:Tryptophan synthase alpha chain n=1 Tax=Frankliniella fusca TaxID=407009 RepID=A0AAE1LGE4_9NEOP|nr:Tryptophan synthase alpha chain [Frankliniella fusca]
MLQLISTKTKLRVTKFIAGHTHGVSESGYMSLPDIRKNALQGQAEETAKLLFEGGVKPSKVRSLLRDYGCGRVNACDLANLRQKWEKERTNGQSDEERLNASLQKLIEDCGAYVYVGREDGLAEEQGELQLFLFIQTPAMKQNVVC